MTAIYHITHIGNLPSVIKEGGLCCDRLRAARQLPCQGIAHQDIKDRRARHCVPLGPGGTLADYVPFYFGPRSPMLYTIHRGNVAGYSGGQAEILHLVVEAEEIASEALPFVFTDGHAIIALSRFFAHLSDLTRVDWPIMQATYWHDTPEDGDRKRRRQAEFLVHEFLPWRLVKRIGVMTAAVAERVTELLAPSPHQPEVVVQRGWYY